MRRGCNCKAKAQVKPSNTGDKLIMERAEQFYNDNLRGNSVEDLSYNVKQNMNIVYHDIYPLNKRTDPVFMYKRLKKLFE